MLLSFVLSAAVSVGGQPTVPAWRNAVEKSAAEEVLCAYTSNVIRCEWAGRDERVSATIPANLAFQFAVCGDPDVTNRVREVLVKAADALDPEMRANLEKFGLLNPMLQWLVRSTRRSFSRPDQYTYPNAHPAVFRESDFDLVAITNKIAHLAPRETPLPVRVRLEYSTDMAPLGKATPVQDYPDILPEETFVTPYGSAMVLRAPEVRRKIKLSAFVYPPVRRKVKYIWRASGAGRFVDWNSDGFETTGRGFAYFVYDTSRLGVRVDILVYALVEDEFYGPPTIISIYNPPLAKRTFSKGTLQSIEYLSKSPLVPYDVRPIWIPHAWKDEYVRDSRGRLMTVSRFVPGKFRPDVFSAIGEFALSLSASGYPLATQTTEYFVDDSGALSWRAAGPEKEWGFGLHPTRKSGE